MTCVSDPLSRETHAATSCDGKQRFASITLAQQVLRRNARTRQRRVVYRCLHCDGYHLGTPNRKRPTR